MIQMAEGPSVTQEYKKIPLGLLKSSSRAREGSPTLKKGETIPCFDQSCR